MGVAPAYPIEGLVVAGKFATIDDYFASLPEDVRVVMEEVRRTIRNAVPAPGETISYQMPTITIRGESLVHFAAWKQHIGLYPPVPDTDEEFERELAPYRGPKGNLRFPLAEPIPHDLIERVVARLITERVGPPSPPSGGP